MSVNGTQTYAVTRTFGGNLNTANFVYTGGYLKKYKGSNNDGTETYSDPLEVCPESLASSANNTTVGDGGTYTGTDYAGSDQARVTCHGMVTVSVPAGSFQVLKVSVRNDWQNDDGWSGYHIDDFYLLEGFGVVRWYAEEHAYDPDEDDWGSDWDDFVLLTSPSPTPTSTPAPPTPFQTPTPAPPTPTPTPTQTPSGPARFSWDQELGVEAGAEWWGLSVEYSEPVSIQWTDEAQWGNGSLSIPLVVARWTAGYLYQTDIGEYTYAAYIFGEAMAGAEGTD